MNRKIQLSLTSCVLILVSIVGTLVGLWMCCKTGQAVRPDIGSPGLLAEASPSLSTPHNAVVPARAVTDHDVAAARVAPASQAPQQAATNHVVAARTESIDQENEQLRSQIRNLETHLAHVKTLIPEPEDSDAAYFGPGTWINRDGATANITRIVITQAGGDFTIKAWGRCLPQDCEWDEVPLYLMSTPGSDPARMPYFRGLAVWEKASVSKYVILTFEKAGVRLEELAVYRGGREVIAGLRRIEQMTRIN